MQEEPDNSISLQNVNTLVPTLNSLSLAKANVSGQTFTGNITVPYLAVNTGLTIPDNSLTINKIDTLSTELGNKAPTSTPTFQGDVTTTKAADNAVTIKKVLLLTQVQSVYIFKHL